MSSENLQPYNQNQIAKLHEEFCNYCILEKGYSPKTIRCYQYSCGSLLQDYQITDIHQITEGLLRQFFYRGKIEKNWTNNHILHHHKSLSPFIKWCVKKEYLPKNPLANLAKPKPEPVTTSIFTDNEIQQMMYCVREYPYISEFLRKRNYALLSVLLIMGLRKGELLGLRLDDLNLDDYQMTIRGETSKVRRSGIMPISQRLKDILQDYLKERKKLNKTTIWLWTSFTHDMGFTENGLKHLFAKLQQETGIHIHAHKFRHTYATFSYNSGTDLKKLQALMRHKSIQSTLRYTHIAVKHLQAEIEKNKINAMV